MKYSTIPALAAAAVILTAVASSAQTPQQTPPRPPTSSPTIPNPSPMPRQMPASQGDPQAFVREASQAGMKEVADGRAAAATSSNAEIKAFANTMVADHEKANQELRELATRKQWPLAPQAPDGMADRRESTTTSPAWRSLTGASFDRAYVAEQVRDHEKAVALFEVQSKEGTDADLKAWAAKMLPTLKEHHKMIKELEAKVGK